MSREKPAATHGEDSTLYKESGYCTHIWGGHPECTSVFYIADNVAIFKPANQTNDTFADTFDAQLAVDGLTGTDTFGGNCAIVNDLSTKYTAWWYVDLQDVFTVYGVTIKQAEGEQKLDIQM